MRNDREALLTQAIDALQTAEPDSEQMTRSAATVAERLGVTITAETAAGAMDSCEDVRRLFAHYRSGTLSEARRLLVEAHLSDCGVCLHRFRSGSAEAVDWSAPKMQRATAWHPQRLGWALAVSFAVLVSAFVVYRTYWEIPPGVRAEVQSIDGSAYLISGSSDRRLSPGAELREGDQLRTAGDSRAVLRLSDGSAIEVNERSVLEVHARGRSMTVSLDQGAAIVQAAKRTSGHLYVKTPDCRVAVTGTVFSVSSGIKGSRVAVLQGDVQVMHSGVRSMLHAGDQIATSDNLGTAPLEQQVAWSQDRDKYLQLASQFITLQRRIEQISFPQPRYNSDLLQRVPADTLLYVSIPNLGGFLTEANAIFHDQLNQSPALQEWWNRGHGHNTAELDELVTKIHDVSQYLGDEVVVVGVKRANASAPAFAVIADVGKSGLGDVLKQEFASGAAAGLVVLDEASLGTAQPSAKDQNGAFALLRQHEVVFSNNIATLKEMDARLNAGASGFANGQFGKQIEAAYERGAGIILAADLHQMVTNVPNQAGKRPMENSGIEKVSYLIAEHREINGVPQNHLNLQFAGTRQRVASWLASPAPIGSLDFVTPNAAVVVALLSKDPKAIADDIIAMASPNGDANLHLSAAENELQVDVRQDLVANLGGDFLVALDGPVLPTPSWKAVIEVYNPDQLERTLEKLTQAINSNAKGEKAHKVTIETSAAGGHRFYSIRDLMTGTVFAQYTFSSGFMIVAPTRALLMEAMQTHASGNSLARSAAFKALLPKDENENYSAVAYQNLSPIVTPLLSQLSGDTADAVRKLAADSKPTAICAWGKESRIEVASDSRLFGFDFLTLGTLIESGNKSANSHVRE